MLKHTALATLLVTAALATGCSHDGLTAPMAPATLTQGVLTTPKGMTLYTFDKDAANSGKSVCNGPCAKLWPPFLVTSQEQASGAYSILTRDDGAKQWAYKGMPLYTFQSDVKPGDRTGDKVKDVWHIIKE
jgi:predicted lipoprotein with Yx(FWY)xxD motif